MIINNAYIYLDKKVIPISLSSNNIPINKKYIVEFEVWKTRVHSKRSFYNCILLLLFLRSY